MFGYIKTDHPNLYVKDTVLYRAMYCGLCKSIGEVCGQKARLCLNYDLTFLSVLLHNICDKDVEITKQHCVIHRVGKHPIAIPDDLSRRIGALNVILAYHKLNDDVNDLSRGRIKRGFFRSAYRKCVKLEPSLDKIVTSMYLELMSYEKANIDSVDIIADPFGKMMQQIVSELAQDKNNEFIQELAYNLGKWIYLIDALDDFDKDIKKNSYNVFINLYPEIKDKATLILSKMEDLVSMFGAVISRIEYCAVNLKYYFNHDLIDNVLLRGIKKQTKHIMENEKCKNTSKY